MKLSTLRSPLQLLFCWAVVERILSFSVLKLPLQILLISACYLAITLLIVLPCKVLIYQKFLSPLRDIPTAPANANNWKTWLVAEPTPPQLLEWMREVQNDPAFEGMMRYRGIGGSERVLICRPTALREVLVAQQYSYFDRPALARQKIAIQVGDGLIASAGDVHKAQKKILLPAFGARAVKDLYPLFWTKAQELVAAMHDHVAKPPDRKWTSLDITSWTSRSALDIIGVAAWGVDFSAIAEPASEFLTTYGAMFDLSGGGPFINALGLAIPMKLAIQVPCPYNTKLKNALHAVRTRCKHAVQERLSAKEATSGKDILSLLIRNDIRDEDALIDQMMTMLAAGHDTSSLSLAWACFVLAQHHTVQQRLREEVRASALPIGAGMSVEAGDYQSLQGLTYLQAVSNEILRLYPAVPMTRREALQDAIVQGHRIPKGTFVVSSGWVSNRMKDQWGPTAEAFDPDRWMQSGERDAFAFMSFSHGPRACIGQSFARGEFLVFLAALVGNFKIQLADPDSKPEVLYGVTMSPAGGINLQLQPVDS